MENTLIKFSDRKDGEVPWKLKNKYRNFQKKKKEGSLPKT